MERHRSTSLGEAQCCELSLSGDREVAICAGFCLRQPTAPKRPFRDIGEIGLNVEDRRAVEHIDAANAQLRPSATEQLDDGKADGIGAARRSRGEDPMLAVVRWWRAEQLKRLRSVELPEHDQMREAFD